MTSNEPHVSGGHRGDAGWLATARNRKLRNLAGGWYDSPDFACGAFCKPQITVRCRGDLIKNAACGNEIFGYRSRRGDSPDLTPASRGSGKPEISIRPRGNAI